MLSIKILIRKLKIDGLILAAFILILPVYLAGQNRPVADSVIEKAEAAKVDTGFFKTHSPHKATIYSMILPGLGQAYNRKYWKIPIIYAGFGVFYYFISFNDKEYQLWRDAYYHALSNEDGLEEPVNEYERLYGSRPDILADQKNYYRRNRDLNYILAGIWYILNVIDATVDAHLFTWEVDDNLSFRFEPGFNRALPEGKTYGGLKVSLNF